MSSVLRLLSTDFDGTLVAHGSDPVLDRACMEHIGKLQAAGVPWAINTGRSVDLLQSGMADLEFPIHPDFILTSERDVFRPSSNGGKWEPYGDWNERVAREHAKLFQSAESVLAEVVDFVNQKTKARLLYHSAGLEGLVAENEEELERVVKRRQVFEPGVDFHSSRLGLDSGLTFGQGEQNSPFKVDLCGALAVLVINRADRPVDNRDMVQRSVFTCPLNGLRPDRRGYQKCKRRSQGYLASHSSYLQHRS